MDEAGISAAETELWRDLIRERTGHEVPDSRVFFLERRLRQRMQLLGIAGFGEYHRFVLFGSGGQGEWRELLEELVNRESAFFRHPPSFEALSARLLPGILEERRRCGERELSLWSAGCSGGQEPFSMAMAVLDVVDPRAWTIRILASDVSQRALEKARAARYKEFELRTLPDRYRRLHFSKAGSNGSAVWEVQPGVTRLIRFLELNLTRLAGSDIPEQDIIFCQNVLVYFDPAERLAAVRALCARLRPGGFLVLAPGEIVGLRLAGIRMAHLEDVLVYQRTPRPTSPDGAESERRNGTQD